VLAALVLLAAPALTPPPAEPDTDRLRNAIWSDLQLNAMIGSGNWLASLWYNAGSETPNAADLHIQDLTCGSRSGMYRCTFKLLRDGGDREVMGERAPANLDCSAVFIRAAGGTDWAVRHSSPRRAGHSRTSMICRASPSS
jgi:hypothetical protein